MTPLTALPYFLHFPFSRFRDACRRSIAFFGWISRYVSLLQWTAALAGEEMLPPPWEGAPKRKQMDRY